MFDKLANNVYHQVMCDIILIILHETVRWLSLQPWGICWITWSSCCAVCTALSFIKNDGCIQSNYLLNNPYTFPSSV